eukprot:964476-Alexandrium_andersonii.AAC.1
MSASLVGSEMCIRDRRRGCVGGRRRGARKAPLIDARKARLHAYVEDDVYCLLYTSDAADDM